MRALTKRSMCKWIGFTANRSHPKAPRKSWAASMESLWLLASAQGVDGKIETIQYARTAGIPFFGICLGMQCAVIEFARSVIGLTDAHSTEIRSTLPILSSI